MDIHIATSVADNERPCMSVVVDEHFEGSRFTAGACIAHEHLTSVGERLDSM